MSQADGGQSGTSVGNCTGIAVDQTGNSYITGSVNGLNIQFELLSFGPRRFQGFVASCNRQEQLRWARVFSTLPDGGFAMSGNDGLAIDNAGSCYVSGNSIRVWTLGSTKLLSPNATDYLARFETGQEHLR